MKTKSELFEKLRCPSQSDKILLITHTDLDGAGAAILARLHYADVTVKHCPNNTMSRDILEACLAEPNEYDFIFACDISCNDEDAESIEASPWARDHFVLIDHHPTAMCLNSYNWAVIYSDMVADSFRVKEYPDPSLGHSSGTGLFYDYLCFNYKDDNMHPAVKEFVRLVSMYDTWDWTTIFNCTEAKELSALCFLYGLEYFEETMNDRLSDSSCKCLFNCTDQIILKCEENKIKSHIERIRKSYKYGTITLAGVTYNIVYCATSQYLPQTFEDMKIRYPDQDIYMINCGNTISMRSRKDSIDLGPIAKQLGGGGHAGAAGVPIPYEKQIAYFESAIGSKFNYQLDNGQTDLFSRR